MEKPENDFETKPELEFESALGNSVKLEILTDKQVEEILTTTQIHSSDKHPEGPALYKRNNLKPYALMVEEGGRTFAFSRPYIIAEGRIAFIGYSEEDDKTYTARSYYLSNSHGVFKYLPGYARNGFRVNRFIKGHEEQSVSTTHSLQRALSFLSSNTEFVEPTDKPLEILASTCKVYQEYIERSTYVDRIPAEPKDLVIDETTELEGRKAPELIRVGDDHYPDFGEPLDSWVQENALYGRIILSSFYSKDKTILYTFGTDSADRSWVASVEPVDVGNSMGIHDAYYSAHSLTTPAYEYESQSEDYGNSAIKKRITEGEYYVDMYKNYLSKINIIKEFQKVAPLQETQEFPIPETKIA